MRKRFIILGVAAPLAFVIAHFTVMVVMQPTKPHWYISESAPHEIAAGFLFLLAGVGAVILLRRFWKQFPKGVRWLWMGFIAAAIFVGLEEISYGQHLFGWKSPEFFERTNVQGEINLHNLGSQRPQRIIRNAGEALLPIWCLVLPAIFTWKVKDAYRPGHWTWYLVPRWELAVTIGLAAIMRPLFDLHPVILEDKVSKEFTEFLWSWAAVLWVYVIWVHLREPQPELHP
jgi:hypothetical protein